MLFNKLLKALLSASIIALAGCGAFLDGKKAEPEVLELSNEKLKCLQALPKQLKNYSVGEGTNEEVRQSFDCMNISLKYFTERTYGSKKDVYSTEEMRRFFGKYFLKENNVSPEFGAELMKIKRALLGGSDQHVSKDEIHKLMEILGVVKDEAIAVNPHVKILLLNQKNKAEVELEAIASATTQLRQSLLRILQQTQISNSNYTFEDAKKAFAGFADFINGGIEFAPYTRYGQWVPLIEAVKNILMGRQADMTGLAQWSDALSTLVDLYELALKYHYRFSGFTDLDQSKVRELGQLSQQVVRVLNQSPQMKKQGYIPVEDLDVLLQEISTRWTLPVSLNSLKKVYRVVLLKILESNPTGDYLSLRGLERRHLRSLYREFSIWRLQQSFIDTLPSRRMAEGGLTQKEILEQYKSFDRTDKIASIMASDPFDQDVIKLSWKDFGVVLAQPQALFLSNDSKLQIDSNLAGQRQTWKSLSYMNLMRSLTRLLFLGYGDKTKGALTDSAVLPEGALTDWYADFYEMGIELKAFDPRSGNPGGRSTMEANFFTFKGNGDTQLDYLETLHFVSTLFTAGLSSSGTLSKGMMQAKCGLAQNDPFGQPYFEEKCFKAELRRNFANYFGNLPGLVAYVAGLSDADWELYYSYLAKAVELDFVPEGLVETGNIRTLVTIMHYVENLFVVYDLDKSQSLSLKEVYGAAPRFTPFFQKVTGHTNKTILEEGFAFLVFKGKIPTIVDLGHFQLVKHRLPDAKRMEILRLFGTLKDQLNSQKK